MYGTRVPGDRGKFRTSAHMQPKYTVEEVGVMGARGATVATCCVVSGLVLGVSLEVLVKTGTVF